MKIKINAHGLVSLSNVDGKTLEVKETKTVNFSTGATKFYVVEFDGKDIEVREDLATIVEEEPKKMKAVKLTALEQEVVNGYKELNRGGYDIIYLEEIANLSGADTKKLRGALASLVKKEIMFVDEDFDGMLSLIYDPEVEPQKTEKQVEPKRIPGYARYQMNENGEVSNVQTGTAITAEMRGEFPNQVPYVRLTNDDGKRVHVNKQELYKSLFQPDIENKTAEPGKPESIKRKNRELKVTFAIAQRIRELAASGIRNRDLCEQFGIHPSTVSNIVANRKYLK